MNISTRLREGKSPLFTFELLPPLKGKGLDALYKVVDDLRRFDPAYINITCHAAAEQYVETAPGAYEKKLVRKRPSSVATAAAIKFKYDIEVVPHVICSGYDREQTENLLIDLDYLGIENIFVLRGDAQKGSRTFIPRPDGHAHTTSLMGQVADMNEGRYLDSGLKDPKPTNFHMGVACYPEKHIEAPNMETDLFYLKEKVRLGAEYAVTQMFFDNKKYLAFVERCRAEGINIPIVPGIKPISALSDVNLLPQTFNIDLPEELVSEIAKCHDRASVRDLGVEWCIAQCRELIEFGVPSLHFYTLSESESVARIVGKVF